MGAFARRLSPSSLARTRTEGWKVDPDAQDDRAHGRLDLRALRGDSQLDGRGGAPPAPRYLDKGGRPALLPWMPPGDGGRGRAGRAQRSARRSPQEGGVAGANRFRDDAPSGERGQPDRQGVPHQHQVRTAGSRPSRPAVETPRRLIAGRTWLGRLAHPYTG